MKEDEELYKKADLPAGMHVEPCPVCRADAELWQYSTDFKNGPIDKVVMCSNGDRFWPQDGAMNEGCLLYMPPPDFYRGRIVEAVTFWNEYAKALNAQRREREKPRDYYADDAVWAAVYAAACVELQDAMDLNYLTGQRPADVLKMRFADIKDGALEVQQGKTTKKLRILLESGGQRTGLGRLIDRVRWRAVSSLFIVATPAGRPLSRWTLRTRFDAARRAAAEQAGDGDLAERIRRFQFRDIRPKAASELPVEHTSRLLGHSEKEITERVYRRLGEVVKPTK